MEYQARKSSTVAITRIAILSAAAFVLSFIEINIPIFPAFLKFDLADIPAIIATLTGGTLYGIAVVFVKNLLCLFKSTTLGIGELANFLVVCAYLIPFGLIYSKKKDNKSFVLGAIVGTIAMATVAALFNYFVLIPAYVVILNMPMEAIISMASAVNKYVTNFNMLILFAIIPFNIIKAFIISICSYFLYKVLKPALKFI